MSYPLPDLVRPLLRRARLASWLGAASRALWIVGAALLTVAIGARVFGSHLAPSWWWALGLAPVVGWAWWATRRAGALDAASGAVCIDRRLGLGGLLLAAGEAGPGAWRAGLTERLRRADHAALPRLDLRAPLLRVGQAAVLVTVAALLPAPAGPAARFAASPAVAQEVDDLLADVRLAREEGLVSEQDGEELERRARSLRERLVDGESVAWSDVDALRDELSHDQLAELRDLQSTRDRFLDLAEQAGRGAGRLDPSSLAELGQTAAERGMLDELPPSERAEFERMMDRLAELQSESGAPRAGGQGGSDAEPGADGGGAGGLDPTDLGVDAESLQRLAQAMGELSGNRLRRAADRAKLPADKLADLRQALEGSGLLQPGESPPGPVAGGGGPGGGPGGDGFDPTPGPDGDGVGGRGGLGRGRGDAALDFVGASVIDTSGLRPERLPPGAAIPEKWMTLGVGRARAQADPKAPEAGGGAAAQGAGGAAWRRDLAPRHRETIKRFFGDSR